MSNKRNHYRNILIISLIFILAAEHPLFVLATENTNIEIVSQNSTSQESLPVEQVSDDSQQDNSTSDNTNSENVLPDNTVSESNISDNTISEDTVSQNAGKNKSISEDIIEDGYYGDDSYVHYDLTGISSNSNLHELVQYRSENVKVYEHADHSVTAYVYAEEVNFQRNNGSFATIDNRLYFAESDREKKLFAGYTNISAPFSLRFAATADSGKLFNISDDESSVSFVYVPSSKISIFNNKTDEEIIQVSSNIVVSDNNSASSHPAASGNTIVPEEQAVDDNWKKQAVLIESDHGNSSGSKECRDENESVNNTDNIIFASAEAGEEAALASDYDEIPETGAGKDILPVLPNPQTVLYEDIEEGASLKYLPLNDGVKETIVLSTNEAPSVYSFDITLTGLEAVMNDEDVLLNDEDGEAVYEIPAPIVADAEGNTDCDAHYELESLDRDGKYRLTVKIDEEWLKKEGRQFPVEIDPTIRRYRRYKSWSALGDFVSVGSDGSKNEKNLYAGSKKKKKKGLVKNRAYMKPVLPDIPKGSVVTAAKLTVSVSNAVEGAKRFYALAVPGNWTKKNINWSNQPCKDEVLKKCLKQLSDFGTNGDAVTLDITRDVKDWTSGRKAYNGLCFVTANESKPGLKDIEPYKGTDKPFLEITYRDFTGLESYWSTHDQQAGSAGSGSINDYTGNLTFVHQDAYSAGNRMPLAISHVYDITYGERPGEKKWDTVNGGAYGRHFRLSTDARLLVPAGETDIKKYPYVYIDADGTKHFFKKSKVTYYVNGVSKNASKDNENYPAAKDEDGLGLFVVPVTEKDLKEKYPLKIVDKSGSTSMYFDTSGYLCMIADSNQREDGKNSGKKEKNAIIIEHSIHSTDGEDDKARLKEIRDEISAYKEKAASANGIMDAAEEGISKLEAFENDCLFVCVNYPAATCIQDAKAHLQNIVDGTGKDNRKDQIKKAVEELDKALKKDFNASLERTVSVTDAAGIKSVLTYDDSGRLVSMTDPSQDNREITYTYDDNSNLVKISHPNGENAVFTYDRNGHLLSAMDECGNRIVYKYGSKKSDTDQITAMREFGRKKGKFAGGQSVLINYDDYNKTAYTFTGLDEKINTSDDIENVYCFDNKGRTTGIYSRFKKTRQIIGAGSYTYTADDEGNGSAANHLMESAQTGAPVINLLTDGSFEKWKGSKKDNAWSIDDECDNKSKCHEVEVTTSKKYMGSKAAHIKLAGTAEHKGKSGFSQTVTANATGYYTASVYVRTKNIKEARAVLSVRVNGKERAEGGEDEESDEEGTDLGYEDPGGEIEDPDEGDDYGDEEPDEDEPGSEEEGAVGENTPAEINSGWKRIETTVKAKNGQKITVGLYGEGKAGDIWFDCVQLEKGRVAGQYNLLPNAGFEQGFRSNKKQKVIPSGWTYADESGKVDARLVTSKDLGGGKNRVVEGKQALYISGNEGKKKILIANPNFGDEKASYTFSCYVMTQCAPVHGKRKCGIYIKGDMPDFDEDDPLERYLKEIITEDDIPPAAYAEINTQIEGWQYVTMSLPVRSWKGKVIEIHFDYECGTFCIDGCMLTKDEVKTKTYTAGGKLKTAKNGEKTTTYAVNKRDLTKKMTTAGGATTTYKYEKYTNNLIEEKHKFTQSGKTKTDIIKYSYDRFGNLSKTTETDVKKRKLVTESVYSDDGRFETGEKNSRGYETTYEYNLSNGMLTSSTDSEGVKTSYEYNAFLAPISAELSGNRITYAYDKEKHDLLKAITAGTGKESITYSFSYDAFGNIKDVRRTGKDKKLIKYTYGKNNGKLKSITYGNKNSVSMRYNKLEQLAQKHYNDGNVNYFYDNKGRTARITDTKNKLGYSFRYDEAGRVTDSTVYGTAKKKGQSTNEIIEFGSIYDKAGRQSVFTYRYDGKVYRSEYGYTSDDMPNITSLPSGGWFRTQYDKLERTSQETFVSQRKKASNDDKARKKGATINTVITYLDTDRQGSEGISTKKTAYKFTTGLPGLVETKVGDKSLLKESLSYDRVGRITDWNGTGYVYDSFGRLISAKDGKGRGWSYEYDSVGNITRSVYSDGTGTAEEKYTYGRGGNLVAFGNERIGGYKGGNPGLYLGNKLTWTRGRQLSFVKPKNKKSAHSVSESIAYTYTHEGIRLSKTVGETKTEYILDGSTILAEKRGNEVLNYYYSSDGRLLEIGYTKDSSKADALENHYTILRNAMGDVAGLLTPDGTLVGTYEYDPYGRLISITHSNSYTDTDGILERNPFRYRGYYYDAETGWYYLQSRYYDPEVKRFINADTSDLLTNECIDMMQYNLFMYCNGDPVNMADNKGNDCMAVPRFIINTIFMTVIEGIIEGLITIDVLRTKTGMSFEAISRNRNIYNCIPSDLSEVEKTWIEVKGVEAWLHQFETNGQNKEEASWNKKYLYINPDGSSYEAVICNPPGKDPYLVENSRNKGTYNFCSPVYEVSLRWISSRAAHVVTDVGPFYWWGY